MFAKFESCICLICLYLLVWIWFVVVCPNYFISGFYLFWQATKVFVFKYYFKTYIKVLSKTLCIIFLLSEIILLHYLKSVILKPHVFYLKPYSILNRDIILYLKNTKYCVLLSVFCLYKKFKTGLNSFRVLNQKLSLFCCFEKEKRLVQKNSRTGRIPS